MARWTLIRKSAYLTPAQERGIKRLAAHIHRSEPEVVRRAVDLYLRRTEEKLEDPLLRTAGMVAREGGATRSTRWCRDKRCKKPLRVLVRDGWFSGCGTFRIHLLAGQEFGQAALTHVVP